MFIRDVGVKDKFFSIIAENFGVAERNRAAQIWKEQYREVQSSTGVMERCQASNSGTEQNRAAQSSNRHHGIAQRNMEQHQI